jgi:hypothetical protein
LNLMAGCTYVGHVESLLRLAIRGHAGARRVYFGGHIFLVWMLRETGPDDLIHLICKRKPLIDGLRLQRNIPERARL